MTSFLIALQFLTIIPVQLRSIPTVIQQRRSLYFYPAVGALIGVGLYMTVLSLAFLPTIMLASLVLLLWVILTGGLHLDGLADAADAWVGGLADAERTLTIMKDPRCGPIGVLSLLLQCLMKWSAIFVLLQQQAYSALILFPLLGRLAPLIFLATTAYVRAQGLGQTLGIVSQSGHAAIVSSTIVVLITLVCATLWSYAGLFAVISVLLSLWLLRYLFIKRVGGVTGDLLGAAIEITETVALWSFLCVLLY